MSENGDSQEAVGKQLLRKVVDQEELISNLMNISKGLNKIRNFAEEKSAQDDMQLKKLFSLVDAAISDRDRLEKELSQCSSDLHTLRGKGITKDLLMKIMA
jgi:hypothetical protein